ncbi:hypothetical protein SERLA73DRAFT_181359 [Serpula lacrymans var. lacrymans S7.3]|uniref:Uncharacterized protein n=1 Tax=Serpula lacrymans var. lacrymans (strain S7.3) TaxID=936435 RepID=F8PXX3_SERL3|nr:hypothetical protein SERLA73DRAFT_181359 [Serpula lacrymans var. lacrymans S7.3]
MFQNGHFPKGEDRDGVSSKGTASNSIVEMSSRAPVLGLSCTNTWHEGSPAQRVARIPV